jgi:ADP-ribosylation factor-like protein 1
MGGYLSTFTKLIWAKKEIRILILGLVRAAASIRGLEAGS